MKIKHALHFITELSYRLADESDYEDKLQKQFNSLWELVNSFKQEDTDPPAAESVATAKTYLPREQTYELIEDFIAENNLDAWWMKDYGGYIALGICTLLPEEEEEEEE